MDNVVINIVDNTEQVTIDIQSNVPQVTIDVSQLGTQGQQGDKGNIETITAGGNISSGNVVYVSSGLAYRFDASDSNLQNKIYGIAKTAATIGNTLEVYTFGVATVAGWGLTPDTLYYAGLNGSTQTTPYTVLSEFVGVSITSDSLLIKNLSIKIV